VSLYYKLINAISVPINNSKRNFWGSSHHHRSSWSLWSWPCACYNR